MKKVLFVFGTRPEAIKMAPLIKILQADKENIDVEVCVTGQHREMLDQVLEFFSIKPDYDLNVMKPNQTLFDVTADSLKGLQTIIDKSEPDIILVQGDTTTAFVGALAGYYKKIAIGHVEAGLRSGDKYSPFPEEINRELIGRIANFHFAPTEASRKALLREGVDIDSIYVVGNTVVDALLMGLKIIDDKQSDAYREKFKDIDFTKRVMLVTGHRRESFGGGFEDMCTAIKTIAEKYPELEIVYPVHLNPNVREPVFRILGDTPNVHLIEPLAYPEMIWLMNQSHIVLTDSGGIQEEAPSLGKPVLVMRDVTERMEGVDAGTAKLVGTNKDVIISAVTRLLDDSVAYDEMAQAVNPYGDGTTSQQIQTILLSR